MALSLGVHKGSRVRIGDKDLEVIAIDYGYSMLVNVGGEAFQITDQERTEILPEVYVSYGMSPGRGSSVARLAFDAPEAVRISRL